MISLCNKKGCVTGVVRSRVTECLILKIENNVKSTRNWFRSSGRTSVDLLIHKEFLIS